jgi:hypothetical protein
MYQFSESASGSVSVGSVICMFLGLPDPHPDPLKGNTDPRIRMRIRIRTTMSRISDIGLKSSLTSFKSCRNFKKIAVFNLSNPNLQVSADLAHILRLPFSGPKIAQKYLDQPVLFHRPEIGDVKADFPASALYQNNSNERFGRKKYSLVFG